MPRTPDQEALFRASGEVVSDDPLVALFYQLMRDEMPVGRLDALVLEAAAAARRGERMSFTNGFLARHAQHLAAELRGETP